VVAPNGVGLPAYRAALQQGRSGITWQERLKSLNFACQVGGIPPLTEEETLAVLPKSTSEAFSEVMRYALLAAVECARRSGVDVDLTRERRDDPVDFRTGAVIGCGLGGGMDAAMDEVAPFFEAARVRPPGEGALPLKSDVVTRVIGNRLSAAVGGALGLGGQITTNNSACTTGAEAIFAGYKQILLGYCDSMYVGGAEGSHIGLWAGFDALRYVTCTRYNELPERASQPMAAGACGFVPGSGAGVLRLEEMGAALRRRAPILCELVSAYCNSGGQRDGGSMMFPNTEGVLRCIRHVVHDSGIDPRRISLINGHLTSTAADAREIKSWLTALGLPPEELPLVQSTKSMIGHGLGAAGAMEAVAVVDQLSSGYVHPSINCEDVHPAIRPVSASIVHELQWRELDYVIKASFGFGDVNGCLLFKRWDGDDVQEP
jgi:3-oxoacyl-(acyl-carrier-protein) synthase